MVLANNLFQLALSDLPSPYLSGDYLAAQRVQVVQRRIHPYRVLLAEKAHDAFLAPYLYAGLTRTFDDRRQLLGDQAVHLLPLADAPHNAQQVHVFGKGDTFHIKRHLAVREYLRPHPTVCAEYGELKRRLASQYPDDIEAYCDGKNFHATTGTGGTPVLPASRKRGGCAETTRQINEMICKIKDMGVKFNNQDIINYAESYTQYYPIAG